MSWSGPALGPLSILLLGSHVSLGCYVPRSQQAPIAIDGQSGRISEDCPQKVVATVVVDARLNLFMLSHSRSDARAFFDAFVAPSTSTSS